MPTDLEIAEAVDALRAALIATPRWRKIQREHGRAADFVVHAELTGIVANLLGMTSEGVNDAVYRTHNQ